MNPTSRHASAVVALLFVWWVGMSATLAADHQPAAHKLVTAAEWLSTPTTMPAPAVHTPKFITIHHAGEFWKPTDEPIRKLRGLQKYGQTQKNWPDLPYHYLIAPDGTAYEGRPTRDKPETNTSYDTTGHVGIMLWGNFEDQRVSLEQLTTAVHLTARLCRELAISPKTIAGHKDRAETACPGADLYRYINSGVFTQWVKLALAGQEPSIALLPPSPDGPTTFISQAPSTGPAAR
jgi:hypothetical protein